MLAVADAEHEQQGNSLYAALASTATRGIALYFSRPVRLFRPLKVSGWHSLQGHASHSGEALTPRYLSGLVKKQGFTVIPKHFIPPMVINAFLGTILWTTYSNISDTLEPHLGSSPVLMAALSGACAGGIQAVVAAPAEKARMVLEGGTGHGWSHAWKEVFRDTASLSSSRPQNLQEVRQVREWMKEVGSMAGRGWDGWGWSVAKDACGFATFFAVFEVTRRVASKAKASFQFTPEDTTSIEEKRYRHDWSKTIRAITLVTGGVIAGLFYETVSRPWDVARKVIQIDKLTNSRQSAPSAVIHKLRNEGLYVFFRDPQHKSLPPTTRRRVFALLRTLSRVGPWGVGFLVWEAFGPGLS